MKTTKCSPITNGIGIFLILAAIFAWIYSLVSPTHNEVDITHVYVVGGTGLFLWLGISDELIAKIVDKLISKLLDK